MKKLLCGLMILTMSFSISGCTSGSSKGEESGELNDGFSQEGDSDFAESGSEEQAAPAEDGAANPEEQALNEESPKEEELNLDEEQPQEQMAQAEEAPAADQAPEAAPEVAATEDNEFPENVAAADLDTDPIAQEQAPAPTTDAPVYAEPEIPVEAPKVYAPLLKIKTDAFDQNGVMMNRVYLARADDTFKSVAQKVYGDESRAKDLKRWNPKGRELKVGDKVYYNSLKEPTDTKMLTYYEENGIPATNYTSMSGENIREISTRLLGHKDSWKEVWATNLDVESKGALPEGTNLRYWSSEAAVPAPTLAQTEPPLDPNALPDQFAAPPTEQTPPMPPDMGMPPAVGSTEPPPPPPPVVAAPSEPEPPKPIPVAKKEEIADEAGEMDYTLPAVGLGLIILAGVSIVLIRKNRAKAVDLTQTQIS